MEKNGTEGSRTKNLLKIMVNSCNLLVTTCEEPSSPCADPLGFLMSCSCQPENHPHSGICKSLVFLAWMCWSRWHPLNFHLLGVHPRGDGNLFGQLHHRKWATSEKPRLSISTEQGVELLWGQNAKGRWEGGAARAGAASTAQGLHQVWGAKPLCSLCSYLWSVFSVVMHSLTSYFWKSVFSDQMNQGTATFQILNPHSLDSPFVAHLCQHFLYFLF